MSEREMTPDELRAFAKGVNVGLAMAAGGVIVAANSIAEHDQDLASGLRKFAGVITATALRAQAQAQGAYPGDEAFDAAFAQMLEPGQPIREPQKTANSPVKAIGKPVGGVSAPRHPTLAAAVPEAAHASPNDARGRRLKGEGAC